MQKSVRGLGYPSSYMTTRRIGRKRKRLLGQSPEWESLIRGSLIERRSECGKAGCRCHQGKPHGPYHYLSVTRRVGKTQIYYVPADKVEQVRRGIAAYREALAWLQELAEANREVLEIGGK